MSKVQFFLNQEDRVLTDSNGVICVDTDRGWYALCDNGSSERLMGPYASKRDAEHNYYALKGGDSESKSGSL